MTKRAKKAKRGGGKTILIVIASLLLFSVIYSLFDDDAEQPAATQQPVTRSAASGPAVTPKTTAELRLLDPTDEPEPTPSPTPRVCSYILNASTGVFHRPGCSAANRMSDANRTELESTRDDMLARGYSPCGSCNP